MRAVSSESMGIFALWFRKSWINTSTAVTLRMDLPGSGVKTAVRRDSFVSPVKHEDSALRVMPNDGRSGANGCTRGLCWTCLIGRLSSLCPRCSASFSSIRGLFSVISASVVCRLSLNICWELESILRLAVLLFNSIIWQLTLSLRVWYVHSWMLASGNSTNLLGVCGDQQKEIPII